MWPQEFGVVLGPNLNWGNSFDLLPGLISGVLQVVLSIFQGPFPRALAMLQDTRTLPF